jgi:hypothetical protein
MSKYLFPLRPKTFPGESLRGYLKRLAEVSGLDSVRHLDAVCNQPRERMHRLGDLGELAEMLALDASELEAMRFKRVKDDKGYFRGCLIPAAFINPKSMRCCPQCLLEAPYHRNAWDLAFVHVCPIHAIHLIDRCPGCKKPLSWERPSVIACGNCGQHLSRRGSVEGDPDVALATGRLLSMIGGIDGLSKELFVPAIMSGLSFGQVMDFTLFLGRMSTALSGAVPKRGKAFADTRMDDILVQGLSVADQWPEAFHGLMERQIDACGRKGSITKQLGLVSRVASDTGTGWGEIIRKELVEFLVPRTEVPLRPNNELGKEVLQRRGLCTLKEAQAMFNVDLKRFNSIRKSPAWKGVLDAADHSEFLPIAMIEEIARELDGVMSLIELGRAIGIVHKDKLKIIADADVFERVADKDHFDHRTLHFCKSDVMAFVDQIGQVPLQTEPNYKLVGFKRVTALGSQRGIDLGDVLRLMRNGSLAPASRSAEKGLSGLLFDQDSAKHVFDAIATEAAGCMSVREASVRLGLLEREAYLMASMGVLATESFHGKGNLRGQRVSAEAIDQFDRTYVSARKYSEEVGIDLREMRRLLMQAKNDAGLVRLGARVEVYERAAIGVALRASTSEAF